MAAGGKREGAGRPPGARQKLGDAFLEDLLEFWRENKTTVLKEAATENPMEFSKMLAGLLPREAKLDVNGTVTHKSEPVSELDRFLGDARRARQDSENQEPMPN